jgi:hypothetical protein
MFERSYNDIGEYLPNFPREFGHGLGLNPHEQPRT